MPAERAIMRVLADTVQKPGLAMRSLSARSQLPCWLPLPTWTHACVRALARQCEGFSAWRHMDLDGVCALLLAGPQGTELGATRGLQR